MTAGARDAVPAWLEGTPTVEERMLALTWRVGQQAAGRSRRARTRVRESVVRALTSVDTSVPPRDPGRRDLRAGVLAALHTELASWVDETRLESAIRDAVLLDELALLPTRQRYALWATASQHRNVAEVAATTGWTPAQVARLLRAALRTVAAQAGPRAAPGGDAAG